MNKVTSFFRRVIKKISNFLRGSLIVAGRLIGVKQNGSKYNTTQLVTAGWAFFLGIPVGLVLFGPQFPVMAWAVLILAVLAIANLDDALTLTAAFAEYGVDGEVSD